VTDSVGLGEAVGDGDGFAMAEEVVVGEGLGADVGEGGAAPTVVGGQRVALGEGVGEATASGAEPSVG
jgi:hypothetical protein